jgi:hypothetical protein
MITGFSTRNEGNAWSELRELNPDGIKPCATSGKCSIALYGRLYLNVWCELKEN